MKAFDPYTYLIGWLELDKWYYGVRYARNCHPDDLWTKYFTSSNVVQEMRKEHGEPDVVEVRRTFLSQSDARQWESKVLRRLKVIKNDRWLNKRSPSEHFYTIGSLSEETREKMSQVRKGQPKSEEWKKKRLGHTMSEQTKEKIRQSKLGSKNPMFGKKHSDEHKEKLSLLFTGRKVSEEVKMKIRQTKQNKIQKDIKDG